MRKQAGFTLIELVVVLVLLGILGAVATARFQDLSTQAADAVEQGIAGELSSGSTVNYAARSVDGSAGVAVYGDGSTAYDCDANGPTLLQTGAWPAGITVTTTDGDCTNNSNDNLIVCSIAHDDGSATDATATLLCIP